MPITLPSPIPTTDIDAAGDDPKLARAVLLTVSTSFNTVLGQVNSLGILQPGEGVEILANGAGVKDALRVKLADATLLRTAAGLAVNPAALPSPAAIVASGRSIVVQFATVAAVTITAAEVILKDVSGNSRQLTSVSVTATITTAGANGLDAGSEAASAWYYVYVIHNGTTAAGLLSTSATTPTLPSGYTHRALVGVVRNDASSNFVRFFIHDRRCDIAPSVIFTGKAPAAGGTYEALAGADLTAFQSAVPPIARSVRGTAGGTVASNVMHMQIAADANGVGVASINGSTSSVTLDGFTGSGSFDVPMITPQTINWRSSDAAAKNRLVVTGFEF